MVRYDGYHSSIFYTVPVTLRTLTLGVRVHIPVAGFYV